MKWANLKDQKTQLGELVALAISVGAEVRFVPGHQEGAIRIDIFDRNKKPSRKSSVLVLAIDSPESVAFRLGAALGDLAKGEGDNVETEEEQTA